MDTTLFIDTRAQEESSFGVTNQEQEEAHVEIPTYWLGKLKSKYLIMEIFAYHGFPLKV